MKRLLPSVLVALSLASSAGATDQRDWIETLLSVPYETAEELNEALASKIFNLGDIHVTSSRVSSDRSDGEATQLPHNVTIVGRREIEENPSADVPAVLLRQEGVSYADDIGQGLGARVDLRGTYLCCAAFGARMAARGKGSIVNIASVAGMRSGPLHSYGPAKAGVIHLTECLAAEWGRNGVRVNTVSPGFTQTPALDKGKASGTLDDATMATSTALGRLIGAGEIAAAVVFLASDAASAITGANLPVDAGYLVATPWASYGGLRKREA